MYHDSAYVAISREQIEFEFARKSVSSLHLGDHLLHTDDNVFRHS